MQSRSKLKIDRNIKKKDVNKQKMASCFLKYWFDNPRLWFNSTDADDKFLSEIYGHLLELKRGEASDLALIIIYDQLARHVFRNTYENHIIQFFLQKALAIAECREFSDSKNLTTDEWCFAKLPFRHTNDLNNIFKVLKEAWVKLKNTPRQNAKDIATLKRFITATCQRCPTNYQEDHITLYNPNDTVVVPFHHEDFTDVIDSSQKVQSENCITNSADSANMKESLLSLSGGVDSMVCAQLYKGVFKAAVHINYTNRPAAYKEEEMLVRWCNSHHIPLFVRRITEVNRTPCMENEMREMYETYTRKVRYGTYKSVARILGLSTCTVILGHNKDDCMENILTNISHMNHYENLMGMSYKGIQDDITFIRPLLTHTKNEIRATATKYNIPHFHNSTPTWSQRGKIRDIVKPAIQSWDPHFETGCIHLTKTMSSLFSIFESVINNYKQSYDVNKCILFDFDKDSLQYDPLFWKELIYKCTNQRVSDKSVSNLIERIPHVRLSTRIIMSKALDVFIINNQIKVKVSFDIKSL